MPDPYDDLLDSVLPKPSRPSRPARRGITRFQPETEWTLEGLKDVEEEFQRSTGRSLPIAVRGQGRIHNKWGLQHQNSADVSVRPGTPEGKVLEEVLRRRNVPFMAFDRAIPGVATGPHFHIGKPSRRGTQAPQRPRDEYDALIDEFQGQTPPTQINRDSETALQPASTPQQSVPVSTGRFGTPQSRKFSRPLRPSRPKQSLSEMATGGVGVVAPPGVGELRRLDDPETEQIIRIQRQVTAEQTPVEREMRRAPGAQNARLLEEKLTENEEVIRRLEQEQDTAKREAAAAAEAKRLMAQFTDNDKAEIADFVNHLKGKGSTYTGIRTGARAVGASGLYKLAGLTDIANTVQKPLTGQDSWIPDFLKRKALAGELSIEEIPVEQRGQVAEFITQLGFGLAEIVATPGGPVGKFAGLAGTESIGRGQSLKEIAKETAKGATIGSVFKAAPILNKPAKTVKGRAANLAREGAGIGAGTYAVERGFGTPVEDAALSAATNVALHGVLGARRLRGRKPEVVPPERIEDATTAAPSEMATTQPTGTSVSSRPIEVETVRTRPSVDQRAAVEPRGNDVVSETESARSVQRFAHKDFGQVTEAENQSGVPRGSVRVVDEGGVEHTIQRPNGRGEGNIRAIPIKEREVPPVVEQAERRRIQREFDKIRESEAQTGVEPETVRVEPENIERIENERIITKPMGQEGEQSAAAAETQRVRQAPEMVRAANEGGRPDQIPSGARVATKEGTERVEAAKERLRDVIKSTDLSKREKADAVANGKELIAFLQANADTRRPLETDYFKGDQVAYTGVTTPEGFREFIYLEGHKAGEYGATTSKAEQQSNLERKQAASRETQEGFSRLAKATKPETTSVEQGAGRGRYSTSYENVEPQVKEIVSALHKRGVGTADSAGAVDSVVFGAFPRTSVTFERGKVPLETLRAIEVKLRSLPGVEQVAVSDGNIAFNYKFGSKPVVPADAIRPENVTPATRAWKEVEALLAVEQGIEPKVSEQPIKEVTTSATQEAEVKPQTPTKSFDAERLGTGAQGTLERGAAPAPVKRESVAIGDLTRAELKQRVRRGGKNQSKYEVELSKRYRDRSLSEFVRDQGGIAPGRMYAGEVARLSPKETGTTGILNQNNRQGNQKYTAEYMMDAANQAGYRDAKGAKFEHVGDFIEALEGDIGGKKLRTNESYNEMDFETQIKEYYAKQEADVNAEQARISLLESGRGAELFDRIAEGKANESELREFEQLATKAGISDIEIRGIVEDAAAEVAALPQTPVSKTRARTPEQLGFVQEGLTQESARLPPKEADQRARLIQEEQTRQRAVDPQRAAAQDTLAELRRRGLTVDEYARQGSLLGEAPTRAEIRLLRELESGQSLKEPAKAETLFEEPSFVKSAREREAKRAAEKAEGIEYRRAGADPFELIDNITIRGWDLYSQKVKPTFEEWSRKLREEFGPESESYLRKVWVQLGGVEPSSTAAKREKVTADRAARGEEPIPRPERKSDEQLLADAKAANTKDPTEPLRLVDQVLNGKKGALSDKETVQVDLHVQELKNKYDAVNKRLAEAKDPTTIKELSEQSDAMEREMRSAEEAFAVSGTEKGRALRAQRVEIDQDFRLLTMMSTAIKARRRELTRDERVEIKRQHDEIVELQAKLAESNERAARAEAERAVGRIKSDVAKENRRAGRRVKRESLDQEAAELKALIAQAWKRQSGGGSEIHSAMGLAKLDPEGEVTKLVVQLAKNRIQAKVGLKAEALVDEVHGLLKDAVDLSRRDVAEMISGYGKTYELSKDAVDVRLRELKSIIAANLGKADIIEKGIRPLRRGLQRDKPTQEVRAAMRDLRDTLREHGMRVERSKGSPEEQQQSALDAAKTRTKNRIEDLSKWIKDGKRTVANKIEIIPDAELKTLQSERDRLQKVFDAIVDPAADLKKLENSLRSVNRSVAELEAKIKAGDIAAKPREAGLTSPELEAARAEQKALRGIIADLRKAAKPQPTTPEIEAKRLLSANKALNTRMEKQIADLERRMAQGDFSKPQKREPVPFSRENLALQKQLEQIKQAYARANYKATRSRFGQISDELAKAANVPKTIKSMGDISAVFRQGGYYSLTHPVVGFAKPTAAMLRSFTETGFRNVEQIIKNDPAYEILKRGGTEFTGDKSDPNLSHREESFFGGETIDVLASGKYNPLRAVKASKDFSQRTFVSFLDAQRLHVGKTMLEGLTDPGIIARTLGRVRPVKRGSAEYNAEVKAISRLINIGTGRGQLGKTLNQAAPILNIFMFSPRLVASRVQLLNNMFNPVTIARMPRAARAQMIQDNVKFLAATAAVMRLAQAAGGTVNWDSDDADFLKIRFGNTTYDTLTGLQQPLRYIINMGRAATMGETYPGQGKAEMTKKFARSKASPSISPVINWVADEDFMGRKFSLKREAGEIVLPLPAKDFWEAMEKEGLIKGFLKATPALTGIGVQTYEQPPEKPKTAAEKLARKFVRDRIPDVVRDEEEIERSEKKALLRSRARKGEDVTAEVEALGVPERQQKAILGAKGMTRLQEDFKRLGLKEALVVYSVMTRGEQQQVKDILAAKAMSTENLSDDEQARMNQRLKSIGLTPPPRSERKRPSRPSRSSRPRREGYQWTTP